MFSFKLQQIDRILAVYGRKIRKKLLELRTIFRTTILRRDIIFKPVSR